MPALRLLDQVRERIRVKHYSLRTEDAYLHWIRRFIFFNGKHHPREMGGPEVEAFLSHLATAGRVAPSTQNQALSALLFLYREVLELELPWLDGVVRAKRSQHVPVVLTENEVRALLARLDGTKWLAASLLYSTGMRLLEGLRLRVKDVDFERREITVRDGKGAKDRRTMLSERLLEPLRTHLAKVRELHAQDLAEGFGDVYLPFALARKYPKAGPPGARGRFDHHDLHACPQQGRPRRHQPARPSAAMKRGAGAPLLLPRRSALQTMSRCSMPLVRSLSFDSLPCSLMLRRTSLVESAKRSASS
jgi:integron integrase